MVLILFVDTFFGILIGHTLLRRHGTPTQGEIGVPNLSFNPFGRTSYKRTLSGKQEYLSCFGVAFWLTHEAVLLPLSAYAEECLIFSPFQTPFFSTIKINVKIAIMSVFDTMVRVITFFLFNRVISLIRRVKAKISLSIISVHPQNQVHFQHFHSLCRRHCRKTVFPILQTAQNRYSP